MASALGHQLFDGVERAYVLSGAAADLLSAAGPADHVLSGPSAGLLPGPAAGAATDVLPGSPAGTSELHTAAGSGLRLQRGTGAAAPCARAIARTRQLKRGQRMAPDAAPSLN